MSRPGPPRPLDVASASLPRSATQRDGAADAKARVSVEDRREQLIQAAIEVITTDGVGAATVRAIAKQAGASLASVHYAFASRLALLQATMERIIQLAQRSVAEVEVADTTPAAELIAAHLRGYLAMVREHRDRELGVVELTLHARREPGLAPLPTALYDGYHHAAEEVAERFAAHLGRPWTPPLRKVARFIVLITDGLVLAYLATGDEEIAEDLVETAAAALAGLLEKVPCPGAG